MHCKYLPLPHTKSYKNFLGFVWDNGKYLQCTSFPSYHDISKMLSVFTFDFNRLGINCLIKNDDYSVKPEFALDLSEIKTR